MLALRRKIGEFVILKVGDVEIRITISKTDPAAARLVFDAPRDLVTIYREELGETNNETETEGGKPDGAAS